MLHMQLIPELLKTKSSWNKLRRIIARCLIFNSMLKGTRKAGEITVDDLTKAERLIVKTIQQNEHRETNELAKLDPIIDSHGLTRVGGRLKKSNLPQEIKHPVIIPAKGDLTRLLVSHFHNQVHHQGRGITLNAIIQAGLWIIGGV